MLIIIMYLTNERSTYIIAITFINVSISYGSAVLTFDASTCRQNLRTATIQLYNYANFTRIHTYSHNTLRYTLITERNTLHALFESENQNKVLNPNTTRCLF